MGVGGGWNGQISWQVLHISPLLPLQVLINKKKAPKEKYTCIQKHHDGNIPTTKSTHKILVTGEQCGVPF